VERLDDRLLLSYTFQPLALLPSPAPGGGTFINDFEPDAATNRADAFVADVSAGGEGVFLARHGQLTQIVRSGQSAPGGGTFSTAGPPQLGRLGLNDGGDGSFAFALSPFTLPIGLNSGVYRFSGRTGAVTPVVVPGVTPVPGGGTFAGTYFDTSLNNRGDLAFTGMIPADIGPGADLGLGLGAFVANRHNRKGGSL
jgi:hypothetical protein